MRTLKIRGVSIDQPQPRAGRACSSRLRGATDGHTFLAQATERGAVAAIVERGRRIDDLAMRRGRRHARRARAARASSRASNPRRASDSAHHDRRRGGKNHHQRNHRGAGAGGVRRDAVHARQSQQSHRRADDAADAHRGASRDGHRMRHQPARRNSAGSPRSSKPDVAMVLNVDLEHTEGLGTIEDIADEEAAIFSVRNVPR